MHKNRKPLGTMTNQVLVWSVGDKIGPNDINWVKSFDTEKEAIGFQEEMARGCPDQYIGRQSRKADRTRSKERKLSKNLVVHWLVWDGRKYSEPID